MTKILLLFFPTLVFALDAVIIVHEAPLLKEANINAKVLQVLREGENVRLHPKHDREPPLKVDYQSWDFKDISQVEADGFYQVLTKSSEIAFLPKRYAKIIYGDLRELDQSAHPYIQDHTDYRIEEPLPETYPLYYSQSTRSMITAGVGPGRRFNYPYSSDIIEEDFSSHKGFQLMYLFHVNFDPYDRFYFGPYFKFMNQQNQFKMNGSREAQETRVKFSLGTNLLYDIYRDKRHRFSLGGGLGINWDRLIVQQKVVFGSSEERIFSAFNFTPQLMAQYHRLNVLNEIDLVLSLEIETQLGSELNSSTAITFEEFWDRDQDYVNIPFGLQSTLSIGLLTHFP